MAGEGVLEQTAPEAGRPRGYVRPRDLAEALDILAGGGWTPLAGGTDLYPATSRQTLGGRVIDLTGIEALRALEIGEDAIRIGAGVTWRTLIAAQLPPAFDALKQAARQVGGRQIQASGTIGGNLCNASPAADGAPPLLALDAAVELASAENGVRRMALDAFIEGPRRTALGPEELLSAIIIPRAAIAGASAFEKLGARKHLVISIAMAAARLAVADGRIAAAALAIGACSPVARRLPGVEAALIGQAATPKSVAETLVDEAIATELAPIDDPRATAAYRRRAAGELVRRSALGALGAANALET